MLAHHAKPHRFLPTVFLADRGCAMLRWTAGRFLGKRKRAMMLGCMKAYSLQTEHTHVYALICICLLTPLLDKYLHLPLIATLVAFADLLLMYHAYHRINTYPLPTETLCVESEGPANALFNLGFDLNFL